MTDIHPTAIVAPTAEIGEGTVIGPYSIIGPRVSIGKRNKIGPHVVIDGRTIIGDENQILQFASIGSPPQDLKFNGEESSVVIGDHNSIREYVTIQPGTKGGSMGTRIGSHNLFMVSAHVGHDCQVGSNCVLSNCAAIAGHVQIADYVRIGGLCGIHQFVRLGEGAFLGGCAAVAKDVLPHCIVQGDRAHLFGINVIGLRRAGVSAEEIRGLKQSYKELFYSGGLLRERIQRARDKYGHLSFAGRFIEFAEASKRGLTYPRRTKDPLEDLE